MTPFKNAILASILLVVGGIAAAQDNQREEEIPAPQERASLPPEPGTSQPSRSLDNDSRPDPSGRVARLQYTTGSVSVQPRGTEDWVQGSLNRPLTTSDNIWADKDSRAELSLGNAVLRIGAESSLTLTNVTYETVQLQLHQGSLNVHVRKLFDGEIYEIDTPNQAFTISKSGDYRFDVETDGGATYVTVRRGEGESTGDGAAVRIKSGQQVRFTGGNSLQHDAYEAPRADGFDEWCRVRDKREDHSISARYVGPGTVGYEDLDEYGDWREAPEYGRIWVPRHVESGWSPYHNGHWIYEEPWGWTWVDDAPWGFAPFHYGRWAYYGNNWGWVPGPYYERPYYAPALVAWFGGGGWGFNGFGGGIGFGWCALGWREPFYPWYGGSRNYFQNVNITNTRIVNITNITNNYYNNNHRRVEPLRHPANMGHPGGFVAASRNTIVNSQPVARNAVNVPANMRKNAPALRQVDASPSRESRLGVNAGRQARSAPQSALSRPTVSKLTPPVIQDRGRPDQGRQGGGPRPVMGGSGDRAGTPVARGPVGNGPSGAPTRIDHAKGTPTGQSGRYVPRPPSSMRNGGPDNVRAQNGGANRGGSRQAGSNQVGSNQAGSNQSGPDRRGAPMPSARPSHGPEANGNYGSRNVPRPMGPVRPTPRDNAGQGASGGHADRGYRREAGPRSDSGPRDYSGPRGPAQAPRGSNGGPRDYNRGSDAGAYGRGNGGGYSPRNAPPSGGGAPSGGGGRPQGGSGGRPQGGGGGQPQGSGGNRPQGGGGREGGGRGPGGAGGHGKR